ncbi:MAG TPA: DUF4097 family beta strand repeat-containing protein [Actinomycetes bacterium]|jgi:hypothetical protein|nr:DUF4097 family beta strand repeat-containing protein [Actinomycetes bacterium]
MNPLTVPASGHVHVEINVAVADIRVSESRDTVALHITGERDPDDVIVDTSTDADGTVRLTVSEKRRRGVVWGRRRGLTIELATPPSTSLSVDGAATDVRSVGTLSEVRFTTAAGDARLDHVVGNAHVKGATGQVRANTVDGALYVQLVSGDVSVGRAGAGAELRTASGEISFGVLLGESSVSTASGDVRISSAGAGTLSVQVLSGDVSIGVAPGVSSALDVSTLSGKTTSDLPVTSAPAQPDSPRLDLTVNTVSGDVRIHRAAKEAA